MDTRREFLRKTLLLSGAAGLSTVLPPSIQRALAIDPAPGSTYLDAEHIVILMQENRSFDHCFGTLQGVRGYDDPRAITLPDKKPVWLQTNAVGETYAPFRLNIQGSKATWMGSLSHSRHTQVDAFNAGKHDKWLDAKKSGNKKYAQMPLTLGYYNREDLPFNYAMADAFTVCDQNFSSAMTSTTPNRSFFWSGTISNVEDGRPKANIRNNDFSHGKMLWKTFPELLEDNGISWRFYQNDVYCGGGFTDEERAWLANFGCNNLEFFKVYNTRFSDRNIKSLQALVDTLPGEIDELLERSPSSEEAARKIQASVKKKQAALDNARAELAKFAPENFEKLSPREKSLYHRAFTTNAGDPNFRSLDTLKYKDGGKEYEVTVPKGDLLHQFRKDVNEGKLATVSWLASPKNFSDHPTAPWYGAWYVSEVLDILTQNPEVWKKTIFILTYDENDGYFDHIPPFSIPDNNKPGTGKCSPGIETEIEHVRLENEVAQGIPKKLAREAPIGLGFRVPMIIASPWSRGGKVCSEVFDHTSTLQFLEDFTKKKFGKNIHLDNISEWRRTICGNLTSAFTPFSEKTEKLPFLNRNTHVERIYNAQFKKEPSGYVKLSKADLKTAIENPSALAFMPKQEPGMRSSCALPYELYAEATLSNDKKNIEIRLTAGNQVFGKRAAGAPFTVVAPGKYTDTDSSEIARNWWFAVKPGDTVTYSWPLNAFENGQYHLRVYGPNGFYREYQGSAKDPQLVLNCRYEQEKNKSGLTGNIQLTAVGGGADVEITDHGYKHNNLKKTIKAGESLVLNLDKSFGWYDFSVRIQGTNVEKRYAGRVETGKTSHTDPQIGALA
ncbi:phospholipase C, phosphocholine-specific [Pedobacter sp. BS3]|uniref:phosphocholine-specific phospholipase C n=1 Tax=Pedobacter sp. BS3 TaxID=2567937 RepID=UPI0011EF52F5|nr:phospholipase C, phosphocholine-specific [Pedobacter sp. BS3]TZF82522.1 phospholipase C, phosphocholine-specific [Pedobacter sp. BS3]